MQPGISWYIFLGKLILDDIVKKKKAIKTKKIRFSIKSALELPILHFVEEKNYIFFSLKTKASWIRVVSLYGLPTRNKLGVLLSLRRQG